MRLALRQTAVQGGTKIAIDNTEDALLTAVHVALEDDRDDAERIQATLSTRSEQSEVLVTGKEKELHVHSFGSSRTIYHRKLSL